MMLGRLKQLSKDLEDGSQLLSISLAGDFREAYDELRGKDISIDIKPWKKGRSLEANAFAWSLIGKIAAKMQDLEPDAGWTPEKVYLDAIQDVGGVYSIIGIKAEAVDTFRRSWVRNHIGRMVDVIDENVKEGYASVRVYYGSSDYDTAQMSRLINILIQQAESIGIPTLSDKEVNRMLGNWKKAEERRMNHEKP